MSTTEDAFLDGRLRIRQPETGYRAGADPVFLAAAVPAQAGQSVLDLGCGAGVATLCLLSRVPGLSATGLDRDRDSIVIARDNLTANGLAADMIEGDVAAMPPEIRERNFDHVMTNPPFFDREHGSSAPDANREAGRGLSTPLSIWLDAAIRRLSPKGTLTLIQRTESLPACLSALDSRMGALTVLPLVPRKEHSPKLFILQSVKGSKTPFRMCVPFVLHTGDQHEIDGDSYSSAAKQVLRNGAPLTLKR